MMIRRMMGAIAAFLRSLTGWYVLVPVAVIVGLVVGTLAFVNTMPPRANIGMIDIPFTVITDDSANMLNRYLSHAREDDTIKAVVIRLSSPGGGAASSERLYLETRKLRSEKPVVMVMHGMVASGGYMMAMGASHTYAQTSSLVGNVGVIAGAGPLVPRPLSETIVVTGPQKLNGSSRRDWITMIDNLKDEFALMVIRERGDRLRVTEAELTEGRLYVGTEAVRLGLVDELGSDSDAIEKAAELAGISNYGFVDVNAEVLREIVVRTREIFRSDTGSDADLPPLDSLQHNGVPTLLLDNIDRENPLPDFPLKVNGPNIYYLYTGHDY